MSKYTIPKTDSSHYFIQTLNNMGYMTTSLDEFSQKFVEFASNSNEYVLEIGAAYGIATLAALNKGSKVICNDLEAKHLDVVYNQTPAHLRQNLQLHPGKFPQDLNFTDNSFSAILISRVLHFFDGETIERSLEIIYKWLKPCGKLFVVADTPYMKNWSAYIPEYEKRIKNGDRWPGLILNSQKYHKKKLNNLPKLLHPLDDKILKRSLIEKKFIIEKIALMNRSDFPPDRRLDGRESVGAVASVPEIK